MKSIDFAELLISTELPKSLALASIAIRAMHFTVDTLSTGKPPAAGFTSFMALGGVLSLELLTLPPPTKKVKGWTLRQVTALCTTVHRQPYPLPSSAGDANSAPMSNTAQPLRVTYVVPTSVLVPDAAHQVGWFDPEAQAWKTDGVSDISFNPDSRALSFLTQRLTSLALLQVLCHSRPHTK